CRPSTRVRRTAAAVPPCPGSDSAPALALPLLAPILPGIAFALTRPPLPTPLLAQLRHPARRQPELRGRRLARVAQRQERRHRRVAPGQPAQEHGPVDPERGGVGRRRDGVVAQPLLEGVLHRLAVRLGVELLLGAAGRAGEPPDAEAVPLLGE